MRIVFTADPEGDSVMNITDASKKLLAELSPIIAADYMQDILFDALEAYNVARIRCGWEPIQQWPGTGAAQ